MAVVLPPRRPWGGRDDRTVAKEGRRSYPPFDLPGRLGGRGAAGHRWVVPAGPGTWHHPTHWLARIRKAAARSMDAACDSTTRIVAAARMAADRRPPGVKRKGMLR